MSLREKILATRTARIEPVEIPEWGETVYVRVMSGRERDNYEREQWELSKNGAEFDNFRCRLLVKCLCDPTGKRLFEDADAEALGQQPADIIRRLFDRAAQINGLADTDTKKN